jgi:fatty acid desaturase
MNGIGKKILKFLENRKLWVWLLVYLGLTGIIFGLSSLILYLLGIVPWIGVLALIAAGLIWGFIQFSIHRDTHKPEVDISEKKESE